MIHISTLLVVMQVMPVLKMMMDLCQQSADSAILFYDEMASVISTSNIDHGIIVSVCTETA